MAFGTGGIWGAGMGKGYQKLFYLPSLIRISFFGDRGGTRPFRRSIYLGLYSIFYGEESLSPERRYFFWILYGAWSITAIGLQVSVNMGVALGLLPTKGLTLPFLSYGGTSLLVNMASIGILMNIGASKGK
jgi:cell division protein FtsW